jgi:hypothetical protein
LNAGERVVTDGIDKLRDGRSVKVSSDAAAQAAASGTSSSGQYWSRSESGQNTSQHKGDGQTSQRKQQPAQ